MFLTFVMLISISFAAVPPRKPFVMLNITNNGQVYSGEANATYVCLKPSYSGNANITNVSFFCQNGSCVNYGQNEHLYASWFEYGGCFYSKGKFIIEAGGKNLGTEEVSLERGGTYNFVFDIETRKLAASPDNPPPGREPKSCALSAILLGLIFIPVLLAPFLLDSSG
jgi:hypothetical protein